MKVKVLKDFNHSLDGIRITSFKEGEYTDKLPMNVIHALVERGSVKPVLVEDKDATDKIAADKIAADKIAADKIAADKIATDKAAKEKEDKEKNDLLGLGNESEKGPKVDSKNKTKNKKK